MLFNEFWMMEGKIEGGSPLFHCYESYGICYFGPHMIITEREKYVQKEKEQSATDSGLSSLAS